MQPTQRVRQLSIIAAISLATLLFTCGFSTMPQQAAAAEQTSSGSPLYLVGETAFANDALEVTYNRAVPDGCKVQVSGRDMVKIATGAYVALMTADEAQALTSASFAVVEGEAPSAASPRGDVNGNSEVNIVDAQVAYDLATGAFADDNPLSESQMLAADVNCDGAVDAADARAIQSYVHTEVWEDVEPFVPGADDPEDPYAAFDAAIAALDLTDTTTSVTDLGNDSYLVAFGTAPAKKFSVGSCSVSKNNKLSVEGGGTYYFVNKIDGAATGRVEISVADETAEVKAIFGGVNLTAGDVDGTFTVKKANTAAVTVELREGTVSTLADTAAAETETDETTGETSTTWPDGALVSKQNDLTICGTGTLACSSTLGTGVKSTAGLVIEDATIDVTAAGKNGVSAKTSLEMSGCTVDAAEVEGSGVKTTTPDDTEDTSLGNLTAKDSTLSVSCYEDGIQAYRDATFENCTVNVTTVNSSAHATTVEGEAKDSWKGVKCDGSMTITGGTWTLNTADKAIKSGDVVEDETVTVAPTTLTIDGGTFNITSSDDSVHSNGDIVIQAESSALDMTISSGDDGIHADFRCIVNSGTINIAKSYEGIEGANVYINDGDIRVVSSDDGINAAGGSDTQSTDPGAGFHGGGTRPGGNTRPGGGTSPTDPSAGSSSQYSIEIYGGTITVVPGGDGIDANGSLTVAGGTIYVYGPAGSGNGCLDYDTTFTLTGGTIIALGTSNSMQVLPTSATQAYASLTATSTGAKGATLTIQASDGTVVASCTTECSFKYIMFTTPAMASGKTYTVYANGTRFASATAK